MITKLLTGLLSLLVAGLAFGGWHARGYLADNFASKQEILLVGAQVDYLLDKQMEDLVAQIAALERKEHLTAGEINHLNYLRGRLENMRKVQKGK